MSKNEFYIPRFLRCVLRCVKIVMNAIFQNSQPQTSKSHLLVATHNEESIRLAAHNIHQMGLSPTDDRISFGQIYGMADYLSTPLGNLVSVPFEKFVLNSANTYS